MIREELLNEYFYWLYYLVCDKRYSNEISYVNVFKKLHDTEFVYSIRKDRNRAEDGVALRRRFAMEIGYNDLSDYLYGPCSVLEMMVALAVRCEETIMDDPRIGNRTGQWFWSMMVSLGLGSMIDSRYDEKEADSILYTFLKRKYQSNGKGGLFTIKNCDCDLRRVEIWTQLCFYLDSFR